ncbi:Dicer-like protein 2 [Cladophialophora chaetospira]|uniref:Dicer-like protein 2 n=1 Tax=Cladophialophora chaetospira TaxID=386627 RepID=A0AA38WXT5_9EURO|nr:Dicer-like protein 2 [Cladophialophora chaetospira]
MNSDSDDTWSDTSEEDESRNSPPLQSRAYQIEMFEHSMKGNIIAVMGTGSGKTLIAKLRMEAELDRSPNKLVWFTAPSVVLTYQQYRFLSQQLPAYQFKIITGMDNAEYWNSLDVWQDALHNVNVVVSTPAILEQALNRAFVSLIRVSLLVIDEAHHCVKNASLASLMRNHYHPYNTLELRQELPHILGLSASPITKKSTKEVEELEKNLNAICKSPFQQLEEYTAFLNMPEPLTLTYTPTPPSSSELLGMLTSIVLSTRFEDDPAVAALRRSQDPFKKEKLEKMLKKERTPAMEEMQSLVRTCADIQQNLGTWACETFMKTCVERVELAVSRSQEFPTGETPTTEKSLFIASRLQPLRAQLDTAISTSNISESVSSKVNTLVNFLDKSVRPDLRCLVFVKTRPTAWSLTGIINSHPLTSGRYRAFSFVGVSNPTHKGVFDFAELRDQHDNLEKFRRGGLNVCVATSVLEEGVDVPAMNLVICFDERPNFRSFVQSRGRARQKESQFVMFPEATTRKGQWQTLENEMKEECQKSLDFIEGRERMEEVDNAETEICRVKSTGAVLTFADARQHLDRFCARLPRKDTSEPTTPIFLLEGEPGVELRARLHLPSSLPPNLRTAASKSSWRTEKRAKQDAAFQACRALQEAGLLSDNLLPPEWPRESHISKEDNKIEGSDSFYEVETQYDPWPEIMEQWSMPNGATIYTHRLRIAAFSSVYPTILILLPLRLPPTEFPLFQPGSARLQVTVEAGVETRDFPKDIAQDITHLLLTAMLGRRLSGLRKEQLRFLIVPDIEQGSLKTWYEAATTVIPMTDSNKAPPVKDKMYLVKRNVHNVPYLWQPPRDQPVCQENQRLDADTSTNTIEATRLPRKLNLLQPSEEAVREQSALLPADDCFVLGIPGEYARLMLLMPSITFRLEVSLRSAAACEGPLTQLRLQNSALILQALTLPAVGIENYESLEFYGDTLLKFYTALQLFADYPEHASFQLTRDRRRVISNSRLQKATRALGLSRYLTRKPFAGKDWAAGVGDLGLRTKKQPSSELSSKTLADIVEAVIGAASLSNDTGGPSEDQVVETLRLFIDEVPWRLPAENVERIHKQYADKGSELARESLAPVENMIGYVFKNGDLLAEALTQSSLAVGKRSTYDRLEFLGDAVLDYIIGPKLFHSHLKLTPGEMTTRRAALASHYLLAFFSLQTASTRTTFHVHTDLHTKETTSEEKHEITRLPDYIRRIGNQEGTEDRQAILTNFLEIQPSIVSNCQTGTRFPWTLLSRLGAPKAYSDIFESVLAAVFIDSLGNLAACEAVLEKIGYMAVVRRFVDERNIDTEHPEATLHKAVSSVVRNDPRLPLEVITQDRDKRGTSGRGWRAKVMLDGQLVTRVKHAKTSDEARFKAAEKAVLVLRKKRKRESIGSDLNKPEKRYGEERKQEEEGKGEEERQQEEIEEKEEGQEEMEEGE